MARATTELDRKIGKKILKLRVAMGLSRDVIAKYIGVTHQQVAKYESGDDRLSVSRLLEIAKALKTDPSYFYSDLADKPYEDIVEQSRNRMILELARNLQVIDSKEIQDAILQLTRKIAGQLKTNNEDKNDN